MVVLFYKVIQSTKMEKAIINLVVVINAPVEKIWTFWTDPKHIIQWNNASDDWFTPKAENDLRNGGKFIYRMEARDGSSGFDFGGEYLNIEKHRQIDYILNDGREVKITFEHEGKKTTVTETFEAEKIHPLEIQREGWHAILENFRKYVEISEKFERTHFEILISAKADKVYTTMLDEKTYKVWTAEFNPTSHFKGSWIKGSKIFFIGADQDGRQSGMISRIKENILFKFISVEHLGVLHNGKEVLSGPDVEAWAGALENYTFREEKGATLLSVDVDTNEEFANYFAETWPKALNRLKSICEAY